jgi:hypothetical protein
MLYLRTWKGLGGTIEPVDVDLVSWCDVSLVCLVRVKQALVPSHGSVMLRKSCLLSDVVERTTELLGMS